MFLATNPAPENPGFVELGNRLGKETLFSYINKFGFGKKTGIDLNGEANGILFNLNKVGPVELATTAFGQGVSVTPIQQITAVSAAINGGILYKPYIVKSLNDPETNSVIKENTPTKVRRVISKKASSEVRRALESVVTNGSGRNAYIEGYRVGGKTGTAQKVKDGVYMVGNYILSFIGFMPADDPKIVVYVAINNPKRVVQYGGVVSAPVAKAILTDSIDALSIKKRNVTTEKKYNWNDKKYYTVENVIGKTPKEASKILSNYEIEYSGAGNIVVEQSPKAGTRLEEQSKVRLLLGN
ncbi:MAG: PASTA domain-containing protein [Bacilli bacterium]|nr:PASTA domain-containing protein [Bacilli bacterium]